MPSSCLIPLGVPRSRDLPIPGEHPDVQAELADMFLEAHGIRTELPALTELPIPDLDRASEPMQLEMAAGMPVPSDTMQAVHVGNQMLMEPLPTQRKVTYPATKFSGEWAAGMPVPD